MLMKENHSRFWQSESEFNSSEQTFWTTFWSRMLENPLSLHAKFVFITINYENRSPVSSMKIAWVASAIPFVDP